MKVRLLLPLSLILLASSFAVAADNEPQITQIRIGFDGNYKVGFWTPVEVSIQGGKDLLDGQLEIVVPDGDGVPIRVATPTNKPVTLVPGRVTKVSSYVKVGQKMPDVSVRYRKDGEVLFRHTFRAFEGAIPEALDSHRQMILTVGHPLGVATPTSEEAKERSTIYTTLTEGSQFPTRWYGYDGVDSVILCTSDPSIYRQLSPSSAQIAALNHWVRMGGQLILCVGSNAAEILAADAPVAALAPGKFSELIPLKRTNAWETFAETTERIDTKSTVDAQGEFRIDAPKLQDVRGRIEAFEGSQAADLPLVVRSPHGLGEIVFVAADIDQPPFTTWPGRMQMLDRLLGKDKRKSEAPQQNAAPTATSLGYTDLAGQLRSALDQFEGVKLVPFSLVASLILLYILAIGPLDFLLLKHGLKRMEWTWFTFPAIVLAFSLCAYFLAYWLKGNQLITNQVDVIDYDAESKFMRGTTWSNIFSPKVDTYDLTYKRSLPGKGEVNGGELLTSWMGLPGDGFGGMSAQSGTASLFTGAYSYSTALDALYGMPIAVWSTKGVTGRWSGEASSPIIAELVDRGDKLLAGSIQSTLDEPLTDCVLIYDRWAYPIGKLDARTRFSVERKLAQQTVETYFKHSSLLGDQDALSTYDPASFEVPRIIETMMFHQHLGGSDYTKLPNQYQQFIDLSDLLRCGRAILVGRGPKFGGQLIRGIEDPRPMENSADRRWTFYRFVFPVGAKDDAPR